MSPAQIHQIVRQCRPWARLKFYAAFWVTTTTHASTRSQSGLRVTLLRLWHLRGAAKIFFKNFTLCVNVWKIPPPLTSNQYQMLSNIKNPTEEKVRFTHQIFLVSPPQTSQKVFTVFFGGSPEAIGRLRFHLWRSTQQILKCHLLQSPGLLIKNRK